MTILQGAKGKPNFNMILNAFSVHFVVRDEF